MDDQLAVLETPFDVAADGPLDVLGVGIGPFNLSLAALVDRQPRLRALFCDRRPEFRWHPGMLVDGARMQVPFLADLVSLVDPTNPWSFLNYLRAHDRLFPFYFAERFQLPRREYDHYCRWVAEGLADCRFGTEVTAVGWADGAFTATLRGRPASSGCGPATWCSGSAPSRSARRPSPRCPGGPPSSTPASTCSAGRR